ncbi:putative uncharacterized protein DDB_G0282133 isoform X1 [Aphidius gifuensis]|uniref:putative uncharacterized protein DDB_G0282133 isoform X1 n=1 Tax=Aphidius gifuensis TaxID=684658 RepID=UPI001CDC0DCE|nr:putative uncharacterized protein DDB_G0282133 isoform X1 [Aphidius gifuensis]XP_044001061.1 putative uncharacterized protein DDB_G0282133 isoform X1 [Aphidius gifuensis]
MGNNNSSSHQHAVSQHDMGRGWTQSFPRELTRHQNYTQQSPGHKVLPEPPNHRLRATNNGSIIHNGGTISGRKLAALTLPHDLNKQGNYRSRSTSASNIGVSSSSRCTSRIDNNNNNQNYCNGNYRSCNCNYHKNEMMEIKKFGSEPDLRYSPSEPQRHSDTRNSGYYPERESRYRGKKKYKAPPPPSPAAVIINGDGSSPDSYKWEICGQEQRENCHDDDNIHVQPPPRKSRLFKTRAETKRQANNNNNNNNCNINNNNNNNSKNNNNSSQQESDNILDRERRWRSENRVSSGKENRQVWREYNDQDRWSKNEKAKLKKFDGKNTLQRSLSSPEFQAELIQVAKKVRNKINYNDKRIGPIGAVSSTNISDNNIDIINDERLLKTRKSRNTIIEPFENRREEIRNSAKFYKVKKYQEERNSNKDINKNNDGMKKPLMNGNIRSKTAEPINRIKKNIDEIGRTRSESPVIRQSRDRIDTKLDRMDVRGQGSGRESTPEPPRNKEKKNSDSRRKKNDLKNENYKVNEKKKWSEVVCNEEKKHIKNTEKIIIRHESLDIVEENWNFTNGLSSNANRIRGNLPSQEDEDKIQNEDIALKLRPTLPKKQLEIPRFSPSAAWRLLSALETPGPTMSTASEELPVMYEERIERLSRPPPAAAAAALIALDPRNSGDSGISGDAGAPNDDSIDACTNQLKSQTPRPTWTPQQDLGEESSSDAGVDSPPPMPPLTKFSSRPHVFSLSLPREDNRHSIHTLDKPNKDIGSFNSLQKIKKSVSGVFGLTSNDFDKKKNTDKVLDDNWLLSTSAPTSLQHSHVNKFNNHDNSDNLPSWDINYTIDNFYNGNDSFGKNEFSMTSMKPPSFSYLASGGHVMYLPSSSSSTPSSIDQVSQVSLNILNKNQNDFEYCYHRVKLLKLSSEPDDTTNAERITFLNSVLNFDSSLMIHGLGLLLKYLDENWSKLTLNPSEQIEYLYINSIMLNDLVMMDEDTFNVLNIMQSKFHPSLFKYGSCSIEVGMNLFTFLNRCQSRPGVQHLWRLMRHPTRDINIINERHKIIEFFMNPNNENFYKNLKSSLKQISRLTPAVLKRYKTPQAKPADWKKFSKTISHLTIIGEICNRCKDVSKIFETVANSINDDIHRVRYFIDYIVDHDMSKQQGRFIVMDGVDPQLDELNYRKQCLPKLLTEAAEKELKNLPNIINGFRYVYLPGIGYLVVITEWNNHAPPEEPEEIPGLEFVFSSNGTRHYKSNGARELDESTGDIVRMITCREKQIMLRLIEFVSKYIGTILKAIENCAELDAVLSLADVSRDQNYVKPEIVMQHIIDIKEGRDPLYELFGNYVANDIISGDNSSCIKIFSGPNACGKTIYMKQIALIVYLTHIGCFLPVKSATIGIVTHILTQMSSVQSISEDASAYLIDLRQINNIIYSSTPNSLILMDEFGRGTSEIDSLAILTSILKGFIDRGNSCPHVLCATHIHRVAELLPLSPIIKLQTFEFIVDSKKQVTFLYRLISGKSGKSFAHTVARSTGLSDTIVDRAEKLFEYMKKGGLPKCNPDEDRRNILKYIAEIKLHQRNIHVDELRQWFQQAFYRKLPPRFN